MLESKGCHGMRQTKSLHHLKRSFPLFFFSQCISRSPVRRFRNTRMTCWKVPTTELLYSSFKCLTEYIPSLPFLSRRGKVQIFKQEALATMTKLEVKQVTYKVHLYWFKLHHNNIKLFHLTQVVKQRNFPGVDWSVTATNFKKRKESITVISSDPLETNTAGHFM